MLWFVVVGESNMRVPNLGRRKRAENARNSTRMHHQHYLVTTLTESTMLCGVTTGHMSNGKHIWDMPGMILSSGFEIDRLLRWPGHL